MELIQYENQRVLVLAPHADDETMGCGGVIQKFLKHGSTVRVVIASFVSGTNQRYQKQSGTYEPYSGEDRFQELADAMNTLGVTDYLILYRDNDVNALYHSLLDTRPRVELVSAIEQQIQEFQPTVLFIPSKTKHQDHTALHESAVTAARPYFWHGSVLVYETDGEIQFEPDFYVSLDKGLLQRKLEALSSYRTQLASYPHPVSVQALTAKAAFRGQHIFALYAEAFQVLRLHA